VEGMNGQEADMDARQILEVVQERRELKQRINQIDYELLAALKSFEGTLQEALDGGLVKPAFPMPSGYRRSREDRIRRS